MKVEFLILADSAQVVGGKLYLLGGGWNVWRASSYPAPASLAIAAGFRIEWQETNQKHNIEVAIQTTDGKELLKAQGQLEVGRPPGIAPGTSQLAMMAVNAGFMFEAAGRYELVAFVEGQLEHSVPFDAIVVPGAPGVVGPLQ